VGAQHEGQGARHRLGVRRDVLRGDPARHGGFGLGSELSLSDTYVSELLPRQVRGRYMAGAYTLGFFGVPLAAFIGAKFVADQQLLIDGWRWLLVVRSLGAVVVWTMRRILPESPRWHEIRGRHNETDRATRELEDRARAELGVSELPEPEPVEVVPAHGATVSEIFRQPYRRRTVMLYIFQFLQTVGYLVFAERFTREEPRTVARPGRDGARADEPAEARAR
jgi:MFS transporter, putative metabolite:H+ symporter